MLQYQFKIPIQNKAVGFGQRPRPLHHNRYTRTDTCVRWRMAVAYGHYKFVTASLPKQLHITRNYPSSLLGSGLHKGVQT